LALSGCATDSHQPAQEHQYSITVDRNERYSSLPKLAATSDAVVVGQVTSTKVESIDGMPMTVSTVSIVDVFVGKTGSADIEVQQLGTDKVPSLDTSQLMRSGRTYLLFLFRAPGSVSGNQYGITEDDGIYIKQATGYEFVGAAGGKVPQSIAENEVATAMKPVSGSD